MIDELTYQIMTGIPDTLARLSSLSYGDLPVWAWGIAGFVVWRVLRGLFSRPSKKRYRTTPAQRKQVHKRHRGWEKEAGAVLKKLQRSSLADEQERALLQSMTAYGFEYLITEGFKGKGSRIRKLRRVSGDGGIDGMVELSGRWHLIQAKRYASPVSTGTLSEFQQVCVDKRMPGLFVATSGFTEPAKKFAMQSGRLTLMDGARLIETLR